MLYNLLGFSQKCVDSLNSNGYIGLLCEKNLRLYVYPTQHFLLSVYNGPFCHLTGFVMIKIFYCKEKATAKSKIKAKNLSQYHHIITFHFLLIRYLHSGILCLHTLPVSNATTHIVVIIG